MSYLILLLIPIPVTGTEDKASEVLKLKIYHIYTHILDVIKYLQSSSFTEVSEVLLARAACLILLISVKCQEQPSSLLWSHG